MFGEGGKEEILWPLFMPNSCGDFVLGMNYVKASLVRDADSSAAAVTLVAAAAVTVTAAAVTVAAAAAARNEKPKFCRTIRITTSIPKSSIYPVDIAGHKTYTAWVSKKEPH